MVKIFLVGGCLLLMSACATVPAPPTDHFYRLPPVNAEPSTKLTDATLLVATLRAEGIQREPAILYSKSKDAVELVPYNYHFWYTGPAQLLRDQLTDYLRASTAAVRVTTDRQIKSDLRVDGYIHELVHVRGAGADAGYVRVVLELKLSKPAGRETLLLETFKSEKAVAADGMPAVINAFGQAIDENFAAFLQAAAAAVNP